jgi:hypothetical protein
MSHSYLATLFKVVLSIFEGSILSRPEKFMNGGVTGCGRRQTNYSEHHRYPIFRAAQPVEHLLEKQNRLG